MSTLLSEPSELLVYLSIKRLIYFKYLLQRTLSSLELPRAVPAASVSSPVASIESHLNAEQEMGESDKRATSFQQNGKQRPRQKHHDPARDLSIQVLEKFSLVTRFARETTSQLFRENHSDGFTPNEVRKHGQWSEAYHHHTPSIDSPKITDEVPAAPDPIEVLLHSFSHIIVLGTLYMLDCCLSFTVSSLDK